MLSIPWDLTVGWSIGYNYITAKKKEDEVKQGKNYYLASFCQATQISSLSSVVSPFANCIPFAPLRISTQICNEVVPFCSLAVCPTLAAVKQGHYETGIKIIDSLVSERLSFLSKQLPKKLDDKTITLCGYLAEHIGDFVRLGMIAGAVALPIIGNTYLAGAMLAPVAFQAIESRNWVPRKISLFMESYMPTISSIGLLLGGNIVTQVGTAASLATYFPVLNQSFHRKLDDLSHHYVNLEGPKLEEIDAPVKEKKEMTFEEINQILDCDDSAYEINPAHCSKFAKGLINLDEDRDFDKFISLFDKVPWEQKYTTVRNKFRDDDRFLDFLRTKFPRKDDIEQKFEDYILDLATKEGISKEKFLANQLREQMTTLVKILKGEEQVKGTQQDLDEAIVNCSQILFYFSMLINKVELEDILLKLAVEGGDYCARGIKRTAIEIVDGIIQQDSKSDEDPITTYENKILQALQRMRKKILSVKYQKFIEVMVRLVKEGPSAKIDKNQLTTDSHAVAISQDIHTMDEYGKCFFLGFYPLTERERNAYGLADILMWGSPIHPYRIIRKEMYQQYQQNLDDAVKEIGDIYFANYLQKIINTNKNLKSDQKEAILDKFINNNDWKWKAEQTKHRFQRLMFVMLGVLCQEEMSKLTEWTQIEIEDATKAQAEQEAPKKDHSGLSEWTTIESNEISNDP